MQSIRSARDINIVYSSMNEIDQMTFLNLKTTILSGHKRLTELKSSRRPIDMFILPDANISMASEKSHHFSF